MTTQRVLANQLTGTHWAIRPRLQDWSSPKLAHWYQPAPVPISSHGNPKPAPGFPTTTPPMGEVSVHRNWTTALRESGLYEHPLGVRLDR